MICRGGPRWPSDALGGPNIQNILYAGSRIEKEAGNINCIQLRMASMDWHQPALQPVALQKSQQLQQQATAQQQMMLMQQQQMAMMQMQQLQQAQPKM